VRAGVRAVAWPLAGEPPLPGVSGSVGGVLAPERPTQAVETIGPACSVRTRRGPRRWWLFEWSPGQWSDPCGARAAYRCLVVCPSCPAGQTHDVCAAHLERIRAGLNCQHCPAVIRIVRVVPL
jgi:hypothetical protein